MSDDPATPTAAKFNVELHVEVSDKDRVIAAAREKADDHGEDPESVTALPAAVAFLLDPGKQIDGMEVVESETHEVE